jgi:hypothetical protein
MFQGRDYRKAAQGKKVALGSIAEEWAQNNPRSNRHKSTLVKVGTDWVSAAFSSPVLPETISRVCYAFTWKKL